MLLFLDSNIICSNYYMVGPSFEIAKKVGTIVLGQIVVDEVSNKYKETLEEQVKKVNNAVHELNKFLPDSVPLLEDIDVIDRCRQYNDFLEMSIIVSGMTVAESYPRTGHKTIVQRALQRKKPFKADGSTGYRDYLVWLTCLELARSYSSEEIHFITSNTRDFSDPNNREKLHPDLLADLADWGIPETRFFFWNSLKSFVDKYAKSIFDDMEANEALITEIETNENGFLGPIREYIRSKVIGCRLTGYDVLVPGYNETLQVLESDVGPQIEKVSEFDNDNILLSITIDCIGVVNSTLRGSDDKTIVHEIEEYELFVRIVDKENDVYTLETTLGIRVQLRAVYSKIKKKITSVEIDEIDDYNCLYCPD